MEFVQARVHSSGDEGWSGTALDLEAFAREEGSILEESPAPFQPEREAAVGVAAGVCRAPVDNCGSGLT